MSNALSTGDAADFQAQIVGLLPRLRRFCHGLTGDRDQGDDLLQATVERALARRSQWAEGTRLDNWMMKIASNLNIDRVRREKVRGVSADFAAALDLPGEDALALLEFRSELEAANAALAAMPGELRAVLAAVVLDERSYRETAELLGIPAGTVMSRLSRARQFVDNYVRRSPEKVVAA